MGKKDVRSMFERTWTGNFVSGLLQYAERSKKRALRDIYAKLDEAGQLNQLKCLQISIEIYCPTDDTSRQITALAILVASMKCTVPDKDCDALCYFYQEYEVI